MKDYYENTELSYPKYWNLSNLYGWAMSQKLPVNNFERRKIVLSLMKISQKSITKKVMDDIFWKLMFSILKNYINFMMIYYFYHKEWMEIEKSGKLVANLHDKTQYVIYIANFKQVLNYGLVLKKVHRVNQNAWLKSYINMNTKLETKAKIILRNTFSSWWLMQFMEKLWKMCENIEISNL